VVLARQAGLASVRFFGGTLSGETTLWKAGIGPVQVRRPTRTYQGGPGQAMIAGPDAFGQLAAKLGGNGDAIVNMDRAARYAAQLVAYMTAPVPLRPSDNPADPSYWADLRAENGHPAPYPITSFDVGNEVSFVGDTGEGWTMGTSVQVGSHTTKCSSIPDCLYAFGGTTRFVKQPTVGAADTSAASSISTGKAGQIFYANYPPVRLGSQTVYVGGTAWTPVSRLAQAPPGARVYHLDNTTGEIAFGDGTHGAVPPHGSQVAITYNSGPHDGFVQFYQAMKHVNPHINVCAEDIQPAFLAAMGTTYRYDCAGDHTGLIDGFPATSLPDDQFVQQLMSAPQVQAAALIADQKLVDSYAGRHVPVIPSAYGHIQGNFPADNPREHQQLADGILQARQLQNFIALGVSQANRFMTAAELFAPGGGPIDYSAAGANVNALFQSDGRGHFAVMPTGLAMGLLSSLGGQTRVAAPVHNGATVTLPNGSSFPALTVTAARNRNGTVTLAVVNADMTDAVTADLNLDRASLTGTATIATLDAASPFTTNTLTDPHAAAIVTTSQPVVGNSLTHTFPAHSVTVLTLRVTTNH
jgi:alpha-L-arabinofuranosidase